MVFFWGGQWGGIYDMECPGKDIEDQVPHLHGTLQALRSLFFFALTGAASGNGGQVSQETPEGPAILVTWGVRDSQGGEIQADFVTEIGD